MAVERVHAVRRRVPLLRRCEVGGGSQPAVVVDQRDPAIVDQGREVATQLALCRSHRSQGLTERARNLGESQAVALMRLEVADRDPTCRLLQGKMAHIRQHRRQLVLVIGPLRRLPQALHENDAELAWLGSSQRPDRIGQLVVGNVKPTTAGRVPSQRTELVLKC